MQRLLLVMTVTLAVCGARAQSAPDSAQFAKYRVQLSFHGPNAPVQIIGHARMYRTRLRTAAIERANFADHYRLIDWGCGSSCVQIAIIDLKNGHVTFFPHTLSWFDEVDNGVHVRRDSRAMHMVGALDENDSADRWYEWTGSEFRLISKRAAQLEHPQQ